MAQTRRPSHRPGINLSAAERLYIGRALEDRIQNLRAQGPGVLTKFREQPEIEEAENLHARIMDGMLPLAKVEETKTA